jgi:hypothetical protein
LMAKMTPSPDVEDDDDERHTRSWVPAGGDAKADDFDRRMDESGQGPRRAVSVVIACPLGIQPSINSYWMLLLQKVNC